MTGLKKKQSQRALVEPLWLLSLGAEVKYSKSEVKSRAGFVVWWIYKMPIFRVILPAASRFFFKVRESFTLKFWLISNEWYSTHPGKTNSLPLKIASFKKTSTFIKLPVFFCQILSSIHQWVWSTCCLSTSFAQHLSPWKAFWLEFQAFTFLFCGYTMFQLIWL